MVNPQKKLFLTGLLPSIADFELAYISDHFAWICKKNGILNPFDSFKDLRLIFNKIQNLDAVRDYMEKEDHDRKEWYSEKIVTSAINRTTLKL